MSGSGAPGHRRGTAVMLAALLVLGGCRAVEGPGTAADAKDSGGRITVWVDPPRVPAVNSVPEGVPAHPGDRETPSTATSAAPNSSRSSCCSTRPVTGWPDAIFFPSNDDIAWAASSKINYVRDLTSDLGDIIGAYPPSVIAQCAIDGKYRCLRNDAAPDVLWYDAQLFGAVGLPAAPAPGRSTSSSACASRPSTRGYLTGFLGDAYAPDRYLWASGCPTNDRLG